MRPFALALLALAATLPASAQLRLDAARDALTGEPVVGVPGEALPGADAPRGGDLTPDQHLGSGSTKLVRGLAGDRVVYQDGIDLVLAQITVPNLPPAPTVAEIARYRLPAQPADAVVVGSRLYVALRKNQGVLLLDVSPTGFTPVGQITGPDALAVAVSGTTVYVGRGSAGVTAYDVSLPAVPVELGTVNTPGSANGLALQDALLAVADGNVASGPDVRLYDVSVAGTFAPRGTMEAGGFATYAAFHNGRLYVTGAAGLLAFDVTDPSAPVAAGSSPAGGETTYEVVFTGDTAFVAGLAGLRRIDVSGPPAETAAYDPGGQGLSVGLWPAAGVPVLGERFFGVRVVSLSAASGAMVLGEARTGGFAHKGVFADAHLYVTDLAGGLRVFSAPRFFAAPLAEIARLDVPPNTQEVLVAGTRAYVTDANGAASGLSVVDVTDPAAPVRLGTYAVGPAYGMALDGTTLFVANGAAGLSAFDVATDTPALLDAFSLSGANTVDVALDVTAGIAYVATFGGGMASLYVADPSDISALDAEPGFGFLNALALDPFLLLAPRAFVADQQAGLRLVDVTNGADLQSVSTTPTASPARDVDVRGLSGFDPDGTHVYVAEDFAGLRRFYLSAYANDPVTATGSFASADRGIGVAVEPGSTAGDEIRYVALMGGEVGVYLFSDGFPVASAPGAGAPALAVEPVAPNPTRGSATVAYRLAEAGPATVELVDALGRRVAVLASGPHAAGPHTARLDARALAPGVYGVRLRQGGASASARVSVVR